MTYIPEHLMELFHSHFFFFDVVAGSFVSDEARRRVQALYADIFCVTDPAVRESTEMLLSLPIIARAREAHTYQMLCRVSDLYSDRFSHEERTLIARKRNAMRIKGEVLGLTAPTTAERALSALEFAAAAGDVESVALLAFLQAEGILLPRDTDAARALMHKGARWQHPFCLLMALHYATPAERAELASPLCAAFRTPVRRAVLHHVCAHYGLNANAAASELDVALCDAIDRKQLQRDTLDADVLCMLDSKLLPAQSKRQVLANIKDIHLHTLPLRVTKATTPPAARLGDIEPLCDREEELSRVGEYLTLPASGGGLRPAPLLLICEDRFVLDRYREALCAAFGDHPVGRVDLSDPAHASLSPTPDNALLCELVRLGDACPVMLIESCEEADGERGKALAKLLSANYRRDYRIPSLSLSFDLSGMLPILLAGDEPAPEVVAACRVVRLQPVRDGERKDVIRWLLSRKQEALQLQSLTLDTEALALLCEYEPARISDLLDTALLSCEAVDNAVTLHADDFNAWEHEAAPTTFFGGGHTNDKL